MSHKIPVILDTDIGIDIDDTWQGTLDAKGLDAEAQSSVLYDTVAIYLAFAEELLVMEELPIRVTDDGYTVIDEGARVINCATDWEDLATFEDFLVQRLAGGQRVTDT